jgi:hypothetical protein
MKVLREPMLWLMVAIVLVTVGAMLVNAWVDHRECEARGGTLTRPHDIAVCVGPPRVR